MEERLRRRRQAVVRENGRKRLALVAALVLLAAAAGAWWWLTHSPDMAVSEIRVSALKHVEAAQLESAVSSARGLNLLQLDVAPLEGKLRSIPYVREAYVHKRYPDGLEVEVREYEPFALVPLDDGSEWLVADDGRILEGVGQLQAEQPQTDQPQAEAALKPALRLPEAGDMVEGAFLPAEVVACLPVLELLRNDPYWTSTHPVAYASVTAAGRMTLVLNGGGEVRLGNEGRWETKLLVAGRIIDKYLAEGKSLDYVDVQMPDRAVAKAKEEE